MSGEKSRVVPATMCGIANSPWVVWDDQQVALSTAVLPAVNIPTWRDYNYGIGGGVTFKTLGFAILDNLDFKVQTSHGALLNAVLNNHIHWTIPSDSAGDRIKFQLDVVAAALETDYAKPSGSPYSAEFELVGNEAGRHNKLHLAYIEAMNSTQSTLYHCKLTRVAASANDYANEVYIDYNDSHYQIDTLGSITEFTKT